MNSPPPSLTCNTCDLGTYFPTLLCSDDEGWNGGNFSFFDTLPTGNYFLIAVSLEFYGTTQCPPPPPTVTSSPSLSSSALIPGKVRVTQEEGGGGGGEKAKYRKKKQRKASEGIDGGQEEKEEDAAYAVFLLQSQFVNFATIPNMECDCLNCAATGNVTAYTSRHIDWGYNFGGSNNLSILLERSADDLDGQVICLSQIDLYLTYEEGTTTAHFALLLLLLVIIGLSIFTHKLFLMLMSLSVQYTVLQEISEVTPNSGPSEGGTNVTITYVSHTHTHTSLSLTFSLISLRL
jgi:hypothetical protein